MGGYVEQNEDNIDDSTSSVPVFQTRKWRLRLFARLWF